MITKREAERLCKSFLGDNAPPKLPENFAFEVKIQEILSFVEYTDLYLDVSRMRLGMPRAIRSLAIQFLSSQMYQMSLLWSILLPQQICISLSSPYGQRQIRST